MWILAIEAADVDTYVKVIVAFIVGAVSIVIAIGGGLNSLREMWAKNRKKTRSPEDRQVADSITQGMTISIDQLEFEDTVRTRKRLERAIALLAKNGIDYEDYLDGKELDNHG